MNDETLKLKGYIEASTYRTKVIKALNTPQMPTKIAKNTGIRPNHISMTLNQLKNKQLIKCINEEARKGRIYKLTETGEEIQKII